MDKNLDFSRGLSQTSAFGQVEWAAVQTLLLALEYRDAATYHHSLRVAELATQAAHTLGLSLNVLEELNLAGLMHDIGKIGLPDKVLQKAGKLSKNERGLIALHPELSAKILAPLPKFDRIREIILQHHERYDGTGYPEGRFDDQIMIESRILAVADSFDALCTDRPYRDPLTAEEAMGWIESEVGRQFCPVSAQAVLQVVETQMLEGRKPGGNKDLELDSFSQRGNLSEYASYILLNT